MAQLTTQEFNVPAHLGIIPDGNRRFAKRLILEPWRGHEGGVKKFEDILEWCHELGIKIVTIYCFSIENFSRPKNEFDFLMGIFEKELNRLANEPKTHKNRVRINVIGRTYMLPHKVQKAIRRVTDATKNYSDYILNLALAYGRRAEIVDAVKKIAKLAMQGDIEIESIDEPFFSKNLYREMPDVDLVIRTSEMRVSGFLPWQSAYSELIFLPDKFFPELTKEDFLKCIKEFANHKRRFGK